MVHKGKGFVIAARVGYSELMLYELITAVHIPEVDN